MGKFEIFKSEGSGDHYFRLKAGNGEIILSSEGYESKESCQNGIESVKKNAKDKGNFEVKASQDGKTFFNLKAANGQVVGKSQMYSSESGCANGVESVMKNCVESEVVDLTA